MSECSNFDVIENLIEDGSATGTDWHIINNNGAFKILNNCSGEALFSILENGYIGLGEYYTSNVIGNYSNVNFVENFTNYIDNDIINTSNYVLYRTNILELTATSNNINISNYVRSTSNTLVNYNNLTNKLVQGNGILIQEGTNIISTIQNWTNISSNDIYYNSFGNVGIGVTPASKLHIYDEKNENAKLIVQNNIINSLDIDTQPQVPSIQIPGVIDKYLKFTYTTDTYGLLGQTQYTFTIPDNVLCDILIIGGGGAGGYSLFGGGGGAGGYVYLANVTLSPDTYIINVGKGGSAIIGNGENGYNSSLENSANVIAALGGGGGAGGSAGGSVQNGRGSDGGSGGGGSVNNLLGLSVYTSGGNSTQNSIYGYGNGGNGNGFLSTSNIGGGGGGASGAALSGTGANGFENSITGVPLYYAGGGGAGTSNETLYNGGLGGGGRGGNIFGFLAISGTNGYGGGGGGGGGDEGGLGEEGEGFGGDGGSGVVVIRYKRTVSHVATFSSSIELTRGVIDDSNTDYKIGNYNGDFKIISSTSGINTDALVINQNGNVGIGTITPASKLYLYDDITNATKLTLHNNFTASNAITSSSIELIRGTSNDNNPDYKIGNYNGDFKIISSTSGINTDALVINQNGNITIGGNVTVGNVTATSFFGNGNGISGVLLTSNDTNLSNYILSTSNILVNRIRTEEAFGSNYVGRLNTNASNYVLSTSNILVDRIRAEVGFGSNYVGRLNANASNYVLSSSNILVDRIRAEVGFGSNYVGRLNANASNYVLLTSNILANRIVTEIGFGSNYVGRLDTSASNYVLSTSNILVERIVSEVSFGSNYSVILDANISNYVLSTNDSLVERIVTEVGFGSNYVGRLDASASNYVLSSSNILVNRIRTEVGFGSNYSAMLDANISNYVVSTNDSLANRITNLVTDDITETINSENKFIVNDRYNNNLLVNGTLTINSNLVVLGESTRLETIVYTTERLEVVNENTTSVALKIQQKDIYTDIFNASNSNAIVFTIANNGDVNISGTYKKNNRDILNDTSNYVVSTSNILVNRIKSEDVFGSNYSRRLDSNISNYVVSTSNILVNRIKSEDIFGSNYSRILDSNVSNYVSLTSNILINIIDSVSSKWTISETGIYNNTANVGIGTSSPSNKLHLYNDTSNAIKLTIQNNIPPNVITSTPAATTTGYTNNYIYMVFTYTTDTTQFSGATQYTINVPTGGKTCDILMVGGGGAGGKEAGAGGGGGAVLYGTNINIPAGAYILRVGRGATPGEFNGTWTTGFGATILGGGSAGNYPFGGPTTANSGGSGSGHKLYSDFGVGGVDISKKGTILTDAIVYNGNIGSFGQFPPAGGLYGGGGGGAGSAGKESGDGGDGVLVNITGTNYYWGGGGGGGSAFNTAKNGGLGGGGAGIDYENYGNIYGAVDENFSYTIPIFMNGGQHTGGGGGGGGYANNTAGEGGSGIIILRYLESTSSSIELLRGNITDYNTDYKIGNYEGDFKIISSTSGINTDALVINQNGNLKVGGNVNATSFVGDGRGLSGLLLSSNDTNLSNYVVSTSNILVNRTRAEVGFGSNYVLSTSNILVDRTRTEAGFGSNYSAMLDANISNYIISTSNILVDRIGTGSSSQWTTLNNNIYYNTSNVGIGTSIPSNKLHLYDDVNNTTTLTIQNNKYIDAPAYTIYATYIVQGIPRLLSSVSISNSIHKLIKFTNGTYTFTVPQGGILCDILMIGGGGAGGEGGGGGGAGACIIAIGQIFPANASVSLTVGQGDISSDYPPPPGTSNYSSITVNGTLKFLARGGGRGAALADDGIPGGCGGGGGFGEGGTKIGGAALNTNIVNGLSTGPIITSNYAVLGNSGGQQLQSDSIVPAYCTPGGGGIGSAGIDHLPGVQSGGSGGAGLNQVIIGTTTYNFKSYFADNNEFGQDNGYIGGGGGGTSIFTSGIGSGGIGGGGIGSGDGFPTPTSGYANTGSGGGGRTMNGGGNGGSGIVIIRYSSIPLVSPLTSSSIELSRGSISDNNTDYKIGNYEGEFKIISSTSGINTDALVINQTSNVTIGGSVSATSFIGDGSRLSGLLLTSNDANISNYVLSTSNILVNRIGTGSSSQWTTSNNSIYYNTSNVGIGTSVPSNKLHLYDDVNNTTTLTIQNNNINYEAPTLTSSPEAYASGIITGSTDKFMIFTTGTTSLTIPPGGINCDILMIGGGGGDFTVSGGGGAGACIVAINQTLVEGMYSVIVGNGALGWSRNASSVGSDSAILRNENVIYLAKGGGGSIRWDGYGEAGGCGSGAGYNISLGGNPVNTNVVAGVTTGPITTSNYAVFGSKGGDQQQNGDGINTSSYNKAGGGGIGTPGGNHTGLNPPGNGGDGLYNAIINNYTYNFRNYFANGGNNFGVNDGNGNYYIGGGGGGSGPDEDGAGGLGGGSGGRGVDAIPNTGSGGCGHSSGGGSGIVIIRYKGVINRSSSIELTRGSVNDSRTDYKIGNYNGDFKIISSTNGINTDALVINQTSNVAVSGNITVSSNVTIGGSIAAASFIGNGIGLTGIISSQWTTSNNNIYYNTSNVGIGTYNPASKLHIYNYTNDITSLLIQNDYNPVIIEPPTPLINSLDSGYAYAVFNYTIDNVPIENGVSTPGQTEYTFILQKPLISAQVLIVGGGGAGGQLVGGGGGGGDVFFTTMNIPVGEHKIRVGRGGIGNPDGIYYIGEQGYNSSLILQDGTTYTYCGGGAGGTWEGDMWDGSDAVASAGRTNSYSSGGGGGGGEGSSDTSQHLGGSGGLWSGKGGNGTEMRGQGGGGGAVGDGGDGGDIKSGDGGLGMTIFFPESTVSSSYGGGGGGGGILSFSTLRIPGEGIDGGGNGGIGGIRGVWGIGEIGDGLPEKILAGNGINGTGGGGGGGSKSGEAGIIYAKGGNGGHGVVIIKFSSFTTTTNSTIDLVCGSKNDSRTDYKVGNYNGDFKIISSTNGINRDALVINQSSNVAVSGNITVSSNVAVSGSVSATSFLGDGSRLSGLLLTSNDANISNYVLSTSNILVNRIGTGSSSQWTTSNNNIYYNTSNVGIGTSFPETKLHLYDDVANTTSLLIQNNKYIDAPVSTITPIPSVPESGTITGSTDKFMIFTEGTYNFTIPPGGISCDILMIGGGGADYTMSGGGGAGACIVAINQTLGSGLCSVSIGSGAQKERTSLNGGNTTISVNSNILYRAMGGGTSVSESNNGVSGGCGSGAGYNIGSGGNPVISNIVAGVTTGPITTTTYAVLGSKGGDQLQNGSETIFYSWASAGGGGIGTAGQDHVLNGVGGKGGDGLYQVIINSQTYNFRSYFANNTTFGVMDPDDGQYYIGGGGGGVAGGTPSAGGLGGGSGEPGVDGIANTGSGGCGNYSGGGSGIVIIRYRVLQNLSSSIELIRGKSGDSNVDYKIGNYNGDFKIISSTSGINTDALVINESSNITIRGNVTAASFFGDGKLLSGIVHSQWVTSNTGIYYNSNVGIGTSIPQSKLHLYDNTISETKLTIQNNYTVSGFPTEIVIPNTTPGTIGTTDRYLMFTYTTDSVGLTGQTQYTFTSTEALICDILIIGGGGGGGNGDGTSNEPGGGGAGGVVYMINKTFNIGTYKINVGKGGTANTAGSNSSITDINNINLLFDNITLIGKGGGKGATTNPNPGGDGGSGGGGGHQQTNGGTATQGNTFWNGTTYVAGGYNGGRASMSSRGGGGGGAGEIGSTDGDGFGGDGVQVSITGTNTFYAGGGNAFPNVSTTRSDGGGGTLNGTSSTQNGGNALADTGSGGSGAYGGAHTGGSGGGGIVIIKYRKLTTSSSIELLRGTVGDSNVDYKIINDGTFKIISSTSGINTNALVINQSSNITVYGNVGVGLNLNPGFLLEIGAGAGTTGSQTNTYFKVSTALTTWTTAVADVCAKFNSSIWTANGGSVIASSDSRIKEDIQDINDDGALQSILAIEPKTYKYIDKVIKGDTKVYGFIAQQIREVIPEATSLQKSYIPNIMLLADYNNNIITLPSQPTKVIIKKDDKIKCYDKDDKDIFVEVEEVIDGLTFRIKEPEKEYTDTKIFVYGTEIYDFHTLDKNYIYTLNVCATQELHRRIEAQNITIKAQEERIKELETKMVQVLNHVSI
jgi:hypothetical protein